LKYYSSLPITALIALIVLQTLINFDVVPPGMALLTMLKDAAGEYFYTLILLIILLESIVYVGFYFPGQFFAVLLVVGANPTTSDIIKLTIAMVVGATLGSFINYEIGCHASNNRLSRNNFSNAQASAVQPVSIKSLLIAMIHINSLAFFMVTQGALKRSRKIIGLAGILNLPYYLALIFATAALSEEVMQLAENTTFLMVAVSIWLIIALILDYRKHLAL
jgi:membrane-associated protein